MNQLPVVRPHPLRIEYLVSPTDLENSREKIGILLEIPVSDHFLPDLVVAGHCKTGQNGANVPDLFVDPTGFRFPRQNIDLVRESV